MSDDSTKNQSESLFLDEMQGVTPLKPSNKVTHKKQPKQPPKNNPLEFEQDTINDVFSGAEMIEECPDILSFSRSGLQHKILRNLRQGKYPIEHELDLHGLTVDQARQALITFFSECELAGLRNVIIVHGKGFGSKGKPVIKAMVNRWLQQTERVLAFHSALPKDGGNGAVYILLKKAVSNRE